MSTDSRQWLEVAVRCPDDPEAAALLAEVLVEAGGRAAVEREGFLLTHFADPDSERAVVSRVRDALERVRLLKAPEIKTRWQPHEDWAETWKRGLGPRRISDRLVVRPSWTDFTPRADDHVIVLDPGMAFGTAEHGTTRGCLRLLDAFLVPGDRVLDVGAGSGILSVAAALLGASEVTAIEGDPFACEALDENAERNGVTDAIRCLPVWADVPLLMASGAFDFVVANIEAGLLRPILPGLAAAARPMGWLVLSGILHGEWDAMREETEALGFRFDQVDRDGVWCSGLFQYITQSTISD